MASLLALLGVGSVAGVLVGRAPAAGGRAGAVQKLQVISPGPGDVAVSYPGNSDTCYGPDGAGQDQPCNYDVEAGATVTLEAQPHDAEEGRTYSFVHWNDDGCWERNPCTFVMPNEPVTMVAIFSPAQVAIRIGGNNGSRVTASPAPPHGDPIDCRVGDGGGPCWGWFSVGTPITLEVKDGNFTAWHRYCEGITGKTCTFVTAGYAWINAAFDGFDDETIPVKIPVSLKVKVAGSGTVTSSKSPDTGQSVNCPSNCMADFKYGEPVVLTASSGTVASWGRACSGTPRTCSMNAGTYREVAVSFAAPPTATTSTVTTTTTSQGQLSAQLTKVGYTARGKRGTIGATLVVQGAANGTALLLQRKKTIARWTLSLPQGRRVLQLNMARRPRSGWYVFSIRLADGEGNAVVLNRNLRIR